MAKSNGMRTPVIAIIFHDNNFSVAGEHLPLVEHWKKEIDNYIALSPKKWKWLGNTSLSWDTGEKKSTHCFDLLKNEKWKWNVDFDKYIALSSKKWNWLGNRFLSWNTEKR